jgi:signal transduction histidine kinase
MLAVLWGVLFVASGMLIALMLLLIRPFLSAPKNLASIVFFAGLALQIIGVSGNTVVMAMLPMTFMLLLKDMPNFFILVPVIFPISVYLGFAMNPIYLIANRKKPSKSDLVLSFFPVLIGFVLLVIFKMTHRNFLGLDGQDQRTVVVLFASIFSLYVSLWLQFQLNQILKIAEYWGAILKLVSNINIASISFGVADIVFLIVNFYTDFFLSNQFGSLPSYELFAKTIKLTFMILIEVMLCLHWLQFFSNTAIQEREGKRRIQELLVEKEALIQSLINKQALAETGALAAGLTHELNQYLARIQLNNESLLIQSEQRVDKSETQPSLNRIAQAIGSASTLIQSIKKLFKKGDEELKSCDPDRLIEDVLMIFKPRVAQSEIELELNLGCKQNVELWDTLFVQVISNIVLNAIEVLETSGQSKKHIKVHTRVQGQQFICSIADNGPGVPLNIQEEVFTLFKTTKNSGTGVGLWLSRYIVERHQGTLHIETAHGGGAELVIIIPLLHPTLEGL